MVAARRWTLLGFILACAAWIIFALPLGIIAAGLGLYAYIKGDKWGLATTACGILFGALSFIIGTMLMNA
jgi:hypothetical protein